MILPTVAQLSAGQLIRGIDSLWSEWGDVLLYNWNYHMYWTSETSGNNVKAAGIVSSYINNSGEGKNNQFFFTCVRDL
ncbi:hypothetical protein [Arsenophonus endosymbiont of Aleurodicus floccissimus]|uniref:hypothetical protein n=1 Tax=Arsenophonus endosymbiont of Aleurodicus floccissimus TaxID=2152761 RepID=UPI000E6B2D48|nr:hypothetical protein [Arsenophonus endosymbiont of Aleurodicus floccissimus]